jgi:signal transduction histidine kinase
MITRHETIWICATMFWKISIADNGRGFDPQHVSGAGNGLPNMRKRLLEIGGQLELASKPGEGTTARFRVPRKLLGLHVRGMGGDGRVG